MRTASRMAAFAAALGVTFGAAALAGGAIETLREPEESHGGDAHSGGHSAATMDEVGVGQALPGLAVSDGGLRLAADATALARDVTGAWTFRILGPGDVPVTDFEIAHEREMHLIVVRRDLTGYQHLHPRRDAHGRWSVPLRLPEAGVYRAYADFSSGGRSYTLATDLFVGGAFAPRPLPAPTTADEAGGYRAALSTEGLTAGAPAELTFALSRDGRPLTGVEPYLGADGHLALIHI